MISQESTPINAYHKAFEYKLPDPLPKTEGPEEERKDECGGKEEEEDGEENGTDRELARVVGVGVDTTTQNIPLPSGEEPPKGGEYRELEEEEAGGKDVEADEAEVQELEEVVEESKHEGEPSERG